MHQLDPVHQVTHQVKCNQPTAINSLQSIHCNPFVPITSLQSIHRNQFTAINSVQSIHQRHREERRATSKHKSAPKAFVSDFAGDLLKMFGLDRLRLWAGFWPNLGRQSSQIMFWPQLLEMFFDVTVRTTKHMKISASPRRNAIFQGFRVIGHVANNELTIVFCCCKQVMTLVLFLSMFFNVFSGFSWPVLNTVLAP